MLASQLPQPTCSTSRYMSVGEPDYCWQTLHAPFSTGWLPIICMSTENQESSFELICFWRGKYEYFLWVLLINIFGEACFGNVVKEDYPKMEILINGVIANVVERRRCQWVLTNQDRSEVLRRYVLCVYCVCVCTVCMCICVYVCLYILFIVFSTKNVHMSESHISTTPASIQGLKVDNLREPFKNVLADFAR